MSSGNKVLPFYSTSTTVPDDSPSGSSTQQSIITEEIINKLKVSLQSQANMPILTSPQGNNPDPHTPTPPPLMDKLAAEQLLARLSQVEKNTEGWRRFMITTALVLFGTLVALFSLQGMWTQFAINALKDAQQHGIEENRRELDRSIQENRRDIDRSIDELRRAQQTALDDIRKSQEKQWEHLRLILDTTKKQK